MAAIIRHWSLCTGLFALRGVAPVALRGVAPVALRGVAPVALRGDAPVALRGDAPVAAYDSAIGKILSRLQGETGGVSHEV
jgi:hypothetical protein